MKVKIEEVNAERVLVDDISLVTLLMRVHKMSNDNIVKNHAKGLYSRLIELQCEEVKDKEIVY